ISVGIIHLDTELRIVRFTSSTANIINVAREDIGRPLSRVSHNLDDPELLNRLQRVLTTGVPAERLVKTSDAVTWRMRIHPHRQTTGGDVDGVLMTFQDMAEERESDELLLELNSALDALQTRNREMEDFVYTVSHDLKSPLITIGGLMGLLREHYQQPGPETTPEEANSMFEMVEQTVETMRRLIDDLLEYSRIGRRFGNLVAVDLNEVVRTVVTAHQSEIADLQVEVSVAQDLPRVIADPHRMEQVFDNLIVNALKYGTQRSAPRIEIGHMSTESERRVYVRDNGPGVDPKHHQRIFGLFERLHTSEPGNGVGLTIVKRIMEAVRGRIWVESEGERTGATFWLSFPKASDIRAAEDSPSG
ncbi:MAG: sensor histidine kinase, partial [Planctomycetota bacterium]